MDTLSPSSLDDRDCPKFVKVESPCVESTFSSSQASGSASLELSLGFVNMMITVTIIARTTKDSATPPHRT